MPEESNDQSDPTKSRISFVDALRSNPNVLISTIGLVCFFLISSSRTATIIFITTIVNSIAILLFIYFQWGVYFNPRHYNETLGQFSKLKQAMNNAEFKSFDEFFNLIIDVKSYSHGIKKNREFLDIISNHLDGHVDGFWIPVNYRFDELVSGVDFTIPINKRGNYTAKLLINCNYVICDLLKNNMYLRINQEKLGDVGKFINITQAKPIDKKYFTAPDIKQKFSLELWPGDEEEKRKKFDIVREKFRQRKINLNDPLISRVSVLMVVERTVLRPSQQDEPPID